MVFRDLLGALLAEDGQALGEAELVEDVQPLDVVQVEVAEEEVDGQVVLDVAVGLVDAVSGVEDDVVLVGVDEGADGVAGVAVVPAVGAEKDDLHFAALLVKAMCFSHINAIKSVRLGSKLVRPAQLQLFSHQAAIGDA